MGISITYGKERTIRCKHYTVTIPDGFKYERDVVGGITGTRPFVAWLPGMYDEFWQSGEIILMDAGVANNMDADEWFETASIQLEQMATLTGDEVSKEKYYRNNVRGGFVRQMSENGANYHCIIGNEDVASQFRVVFNVSYSQYKMDNIVEEWLDRIQFEGSRSYEELKREREERERQEAKQAQEREKKMAEEAKKAEERKAQVENEIRKNTKEVQESLQWKLQEKLDSLKKDKADAEGRIEKCKADIESKTAQRDSLGFFGFMKKSQLQKEIDQLNQQIEEEQKIISNCQVLVDTYPDKVDEVYTKYELAYREYLESKSDGLQDEILEILSKAHNALIVKEIIAELRTETTETKVSAIMKKLVDSGIAVKTIWKNRSYYSLRTENSGINPPEKPKFPELAIK